jgi:hypothetical protein
VRKIASFFELELDTTAPDIEILSPSYTTKSQPIDIVIEANEELSSYQDLYLVDNHGKKHQLTFKHMGTYLEGVINTGSIPVGVTTIYAQVKDTVDNLSKLVSYSFKIIGGNPLRLEVKDFQSEINIGSKCRHIASTSYSRKTITDSKSRDISLYSGDRNVIVGISEEVK